MSYYFEPLAVCKSQQFFLDINDIAVSGFLQRHINIG